LDPKSDLAKEIIETFQRISGDRSTFESHWEEIAQRVWPAHSQLFLSKGYRQAGQKLTQELFDSTAELGLSRFGAILDSLLTPRNQTWHQLTTSNKDLNKNREVKLYFEQVNALLFEHRYAPMSNFAAQNQQNYKALGAFGTGCMYVDQLWGATGLRYRAIPLGEIYFQENHQGLVDTAYRYFSLTARQAAQQWGKEKLPSQMKTALEKNLQTPFYFIHCVKPRTEGFDPGRKDFKGMPFASYYISELEKVLLSEGGYSTFPYAISRYEQSPGEVYGRSPAMSVLPAIKTLNEQKKTVLKQGHRIVDPVLLAADDGIVDTFSLAPGAVNAGGVSSDGRPLVHVLPTGNLAVSKEMMDDERQVINDAFLVTLFQILVESPQMTATEVMERSREKGILLAPTIGRQQSEYLGPMIDRELDLLSQQRVLPPMPRALIEARGEYKIRYDSPLSRLQRAEEASGIMRVVEKALEVVNVTQNPEPLDFFDWDVIIPDLSDIHGVPTHWMRSLDKIKAMRDGRAQQAQAQQAAQMAPGAAAMIKATAVANKGQG
jgi:hypothetical protein